jgi:hypothetical protein
MIWRKLFFWQAVIILAVGLSVTAQNNNLLTNGSFESGKPSLWNAEQGSGAVLTWANDQVHSGTRSLKIEKTGTGEMSRWLSDNNVRYWVTEIGSGVDIKVGAWVKTEGVNTNPANDDEKWQLKFWFYDASDELIGGVPYVLDIDQSVATKDWYADTNGVGELNLPVNAEKLYISAEAGSAATGTVWFDTFIFVGRDGWAGQNWNGFVDADEEWQYWIAPGGGNDGMTFFPGSGVTDEEARSGDYSLKIHAPVGREPGELVWISETVPIPEGSEGKMYVLSAWVRTTDIIPDSLFNSSYAIGFTWTYHSQMFEDGGGWNEIMGADHRFVLTQPEQGWTRYQVAFAIPTNEVRAISVRARAWHVFTGTAYFDDFSLSPLGDDNLVAELGSFDSGKPSLWNAEEGSGAVLTWAEGEGHYGTYALKIEKTGTGEMSRWVSDNHVRYWVTEVSPGVDIKVGAGVKTEGVNTNPANDDEKWQLKFWFYDESDELIGDVPYTLDIDQGVATKDWYADTNGVGELNLPIAATKLLISAEAGPNATGTVWFDTFIFVGRDGWAGQNWNGFVDADEGWQYWIAPGGGNDGMTFFPGSGTTTEEAYDGDYSLKINAPVGREPGELVWISETVPIPEGSEGKQYVLTTWVRTQDVIPDSIFNSSYSIGLTWTWHTQMFEDGGGWNETAGEDYRFYLTQPEQGWTQYTAIMTVPNNDVRAVSIRPRSWHVFTGVTYYDSFAMYEIKDVEVSVPGGDYPPYGEGVAHEYRLLQNYPNPFNPTTNIEFYLPVQSKVRLEVYNLLGQKVRTLLYDTQASGIHTITWNATDDAGSPVSSGVYIYRLQTENMTITKKMVLVR